MAGSWPIVMHSFRGATNLRVLVTGSGGQIGRALIGMAPGGADVRGVQREALDIADRDAVATLFDAVRPQLVINAAAYTAVDRAEAEPEAAFRVNSVGPAVLAGAAAARGIGFVHLSSDFVFDGTASVPYPSDAPTGPLSVYGASKAAGERAVRLLHCEALIVRTSWIYGVRGQNFVNTMLRLFAGPGPVRVVADQVGIPTHADSFATALWQLIDSKARGTWHLTDAGPATWHDLAVAIGETAHRLGLLPRPPSVQPVLSADYAAAARRPAFSVLDSSRSWARIGLSPPHWRAELQTMLEQVKAKLA